MNYSRIYQLMPTAEGTYALRGAMADHNNDEVHHALFDALRTVFHTQSRRQFGFFDPESNGVAIAAMNDYLQQNLSADELGLKFAQYLQTSIPVSQPEHSWYLWFIIEHGGDDQYLYLFLLKHDTGHYISAQQTVASGLSIQPGHLHYAIKLNLTEWQDAQSKTYLSYLAPKNKHPLTLAWSGLIGFAEGANRAEQTEGFLTTLESYADELPPEKEQEYRARVVDYCLDRERAGEPVEIEALSRHVNEDAPEALMNFFAARADEPISAGYPDQLYPDRKQIRRYTRLFGRDNDLSIGFSTLMLGRDIIYDERTETLTIRTIPKSLKAQLARHVKKTE